MAIIIFVPMPKHPANKNPRISTIERKNSEHEQSPSKSHNEPSRSRCVREATSDQIASGHTDAKYRERFL
jgi:hypothetical protein